MTDHPPPIYDLRIDELVLENFSPADQRSLVAALRRELARILSDAGAHGAPKRDFTVADVGVATLAPGASPQKLGIEAARSIGRALGVVGSGPGGRPPAGARR
ncbi:MAG TPA: hypothetical protein VMU18_12160 [Rhodoblastus sp.]|nr:hypothetical protein [Rhodoblastus sp.]